jgi:hypothetical protein
MKGASEVGTDGGEGTGVGRRKEVCETWPGRRTKKCQGRVQAPE